MNPFSKTRPQFLIFVIILFFLTTAFVPFPQAADPPTLTQVLGTLLVITGLAFLVETLVEAVCGRLVDFFHLDKYRPLLIYVAVVVGIGGAFVYHFDLIYLLARSVEVPVAVTAYGTAITGIAIGMGAGYIHQFISKFFPAKQTITMNGVTWTKPS